MLTMDYIYNGNIVKVLDGDTVDVTIDLGFNIYSKQRLRLARINALEIKSKIEDERKKAEEAKTWLSSFLDTSVIFKSTKKDKYGRYIVELYTPNGLVSLNQQLLDLGLAKPYVE